MGKDKRTVNVEIFEDTSMFCKSNSKLKAAIENSNRQQQVITEGEILGNTGEHRYSAPARIIVSKKRTFEAAAGYRDKKVCVHNFASATNPGGGVTKGSSAQEECLCRCSTLYFNLTDKPAMKDFYNAHRGRLTALYNDDCIYTPEVVVFKSDTDEPQTVSEESWYNVNVLTCAAPNLRINPSNEMNPGSGKTKAEVTDKELFELHKKRLRRIFEIAKLNGNEVLISGAFGCGAFKNPPHVVAEAFHEVIKEYMYDFEVIELAVYCSKKDTTNYEVFERRLGRMK